MFHLEGNFKKITLISSDEFSLNEVRYPSKEVGLVAPGFAIEFDILFKANSLADY